MTHSGTVPIYNIKLSGISSVQTILTGATKVRFCRHNYSDKTLNVLSL
jgi:hypothetical protein